MPLFPCRQCECIENTACAGSYWYNRHHGLPLLCSECNSGTWHGKFPKSPAAGWHVDDDGHLWRPGENPPHIKIVGAIEPTSTESKP